MAYKLLPAGNALAIAEREFATAAVLGFTAFTSCIGVVVLDNNTLTGVHLSMTGGGAVATPFNKMGVAQVIGLVGDTYTRAVVFGCVNFWKNPQNGVLDNYLDMIARLNPLTIRDIGNGTYTATILGAEIVIT